MYAVTGASGQLGRLVVQELLTKVEPSRIVALVRDPSKVTEIAERGVVVRAFDYSAPSTLAPALEGVDRLLLVSSSEVGRREPQHRAVIDAAKAAGVGFLAYTSLLHADSSPLSLAVEHRATEAVIKASGIPYAFLRNGWYTENYTMSAAMEVAHGAVIGSSGEGRVSPATRADLAAAAATVLLDPLVVNWTYELAGDESFTLAEYAGVLSKVSGKPVSYVNMPEAEYRAALEGAGLPSPVASVIAESSANAATGALFEAGRALSALIGRPTTPLSTVVVETLG